MSAVTSPAALLEDPRAGKMVFCVSGIMVTFLLYGLIQESIMTQPFGVDAFGENVFFTYSAFLVLNNRIVSMITAAVSMIYAKESLANVAPLQNYFWISFSNFFATYCQYEALRYVSFPTQTLGKCGKMIAVMILGMFLTGKKYGNKDFLQAFAVTFGCFMFLMTGDISSGASDRSDSIYGLILMCGYIFSDGFTSTFQEKMFKGYTMSTNNQMLYINMSSAIISVLTLLAKGELGPSIEFSLQYPSLMTNSIALSICATAGQQVIYYCIKEFGALVFATIMTTRQLVGIVLSCFIYWHPLSIGQWAASILVFGTLYYQAVNKTHHHGPKKPAPPSEAQEEKLAEIITPSPKDRDD